MRGTSGFAFRLVVLIGLMIALAAGLTVLLNQLKFRQVIERQQARIAQLVAGDLAETFEQSIGLGVQLANVPGGQVRLDRRRADDSTIARLAVLDPGGRILFDTERRHIGESAPPMWTAGPGAGGDTRQGAQRWVSVEIENSFRRAEGRLVLVYDLEAQQDRLTAITLTMLRAALLALAVALPVAAIAIPLIARPTRRWFATIAAVLGGSATPTEGSPVASDLREAVARANTAFDRAEAELEAEVVAVAGGAGMAGGGAGMAAGGAGMAGGGAGMAAGAGAGAARDAGPGPSPAPALAGGGA